MPDSSFTTAMEGQETAASLARVPAVGSAAAVSGPRSVARFVEPAPPLDKRQTRAPQRAIDTPADGELVVDSR
jgi:hypothetical protein